MVYPPGIGKTPNDWAEEEARRKESHARVDNPYGQAPSRTTRLVLGWMAVLAMVAIVVVTVLGLLGVVDVFGPPR